MNPYGSTSGENSSRIIARLGLDQSADADKSSRAMSELKFSPRPDKKELDESLAFSPKFDSDGLIAAMAIDHATREPLMLAYMNEESLKMTIEKGEAVYYSRSRQEIWHKGATSGHTQVVHEIRTDCDQDALILYVTQQGAGACHTGRRSCFYRAVSFPQNNPVDLEFVDNERTFDPDQVYGEK